MNNNQFQYTNSVAVVPFLMVLMMWTVFWFERRFQINLTYLGIYPRNLMGLRGIIFSPFLHGNIEHLLNNTIPIFVLTAALSFFYHKQYLKTLIFGIILSGFFTWLIGRPNLHIGASSLIYVLFSFMFFKGLQTRYYRLVALSLAIVTFYGGLVWYVFPGIDPNISWEGHLSGFITGIFFTITFKAETYQKPKKYDWEQPDYDPSKDKFMQRFDENGNFVNLPKEIYTIENQQNNEDLSIENYFYSNNTAGNLRIRYQ